MADSHPTDTSAYTKPGLSCDLIDGTPIKTVHKWPINAVFIIHRSGTLALPMIAIILIYRRDLSELLRNIISC